MSSPNDTSDRIEDDGLPQSLYSLLPNLQLKRGALKVTSLQPTRVRLIHRFITSLHLLLYETTIPLHF